MLVLTLLFQLAEEVMAVQKPHVMQGTDEFKLKQRLSGTVFDSSFLAAPRTSRR